ncbi:hypothetical protein UF75_0865 [Desulfosporosinus sp. I2]|nr:hypothetical protein UF75_0865 [Desulfosporosinus sp. I2]
MICFAFRETGGQVICFAFRSGYCGGTLAIYVRMMVTRSIHLSSE